MNLPDYDPILSPLELPVQQWRVPGHFEHPVVFPEREGATPGTLLWGAFGEALWQTSCANPKLWPKPGGVRAFTNPPGMRVRRRGKNFQGKNPPFRERFAYNAPRTRIPGGFQRMVLQPHLANAGD